MIFISDDTTLMPGDCILYFRDSLFSWIIALKTWTKVAHVEIYRGDNTCYASREGWGVDVYSFNRDGVAAVLRPKQSPDLIAADLWFHEVHLQPYDWLGLFCFTLARKRGEPRKMFCSEFATRFYRAAGLEPFNQRWPADRVPPSFFLASPAFDVIWSDHDWF